MTTSTKARASKIAEILKRGPADKRGLKLKPGDIILSIDKMALTPDLDLAVPLNDKVNETVTCEVTSNPADPKATRQGGTAGGQPAEHPAADV